MEANIKVSSSESTSKDEKRRKSKTRSKLQKLRISLKYRPDILKIILKLRQCIRVRNKLLAKVHQELKTKTVKTTNQSVQTENNEKLETLKSEACTENSKENDNSQDAGWSLDQGSGDGEKSIADQVKEAAQSAMAESGMVYVESAGMYYDYKTGYYYHSELGLYYHTDTGCYYYYSDEKKTFVFHSYPDRSKENLALLKHEKKKAKKHKQEKEETVEESKPKKSKKKNRKVDNSAAEKIKKKSKIEKSDEKIVIDDDGANDNNDKEQTAAELEDGECSDTDDEAGDTSSVISDSTVTDNEDAVSKHHPPCMRVIVRETSLPKLKVGSLFLVTKDGGTVGREGDHVVLLRDVNVSRTHMEIKYDTNRQAYFVMDLGSKNGTILNGKRMSESQVSSSFIEVQHGSTIQVGETKLLCHIHPGSDTCGHCEPGLIMAEDDKTTRVAYTRTCDIQKQHQLELARLKNKYAPEPLAIEEGSYKDRAKERRETVGSSHQAEKTQQSDLDTCIAADNKGFKLLQKMGWSKGEGLGKESQGDTEPIPLVSNESKAGLGAAGSAAPVQVGAVGSMPLRVTRPRAKPLRPPAKLFRDPLEEDD